MRNYGLVRKFPPAGASGWAIYRKTVYRELNRTLNTMHFGGPRCDESRICTPLPLPILTRGFLLARPVTCSSLYDCVR